MSKILVTGALGQIGAELVPELRERHGTDNVIASGWRRRADSPVVDGGPFEIVDCTKPGDIAAVVEKHEIGTIYHMPAFLSVLGEERPEDAWALNLGGYANALEVARRHGCKVFFPSSIGAFGPGTPLQNTPQDTIQRPNTIYGVSKVAGELLGDYYHTRFGLDTRGLRLPGLISHVALPGGGTTDYAVHIFYEALSEGRYTCFLRPDSRLDMMYMPDAVTAILDLMEADPTRLRHRNAFNVTAMAPPSQRLQRDRHEPHAAGGACRRDPPPMSCTSPASRSTTSPCGSPRSTRSVGRQAIADSPDRMAGFDGRQRRPRPSFALPSGDTEFLDRLGLAVRDAIERLAAAATT